MSKLPVVNVHNVRKYAPVIYIASLIAISVFFYDGKHLWTWHMGC